MPKDPNQRAKTVKSRDITETSVACLKTQREQTEDALKNPVTKNSGANNSDPNSNVNDNNNKNSHENSNRAELKPKTVYPP